jgi:hypothetical protein
VGFPFGVEGLGLKQIIIKCPRGIQEQLNGLPCFEHVGVIAAAGETKKPAPQTGIESRLDGKRGVGPE